MMKKFRRGLCLALMMVMLVCDCSVQANVSTGDGKSEASAIRLTLGKTKSAKLEEGQLFIFFEVVLSEPGKLELFLSADKIGTSVDVEMYKYTNEWSFWKQEKTIKYSKSKKKLSGTMTSEDVLPRGLYIIRVKPKKILKSAKKIKLKAQLTGAGYDDVEPNSSETDAQPMDVTGKNGVRTYKMMLTNLALLDREDLMDCFSLKLKESKQLHLKLSLKKPVDDLVVLLCKKSAEGSVLVKQYDVTGKKLDKSVKLGKGTYYVKVWYRGEQVQQIPYTISGSVSQRVTAVKLNKSKLTLWVDKNYGATSANLKATVSPSNATNKKLKWTSSKSKVAKVSSTGKVTARSVGKTTITVSATDGSKKFAKCMVTVKAPAPKISGAESLTEGNYTKYTTTVPGGKWMSSDESVLSLVSTDAGSVTVKAKKTGTATITYVANGVESNKISVRVKKASSKPTQPTSPIIQGPGVVWVGQSITFSVTNGVSGGSWYSGDTSILSGSGGGSSCSMTGRRAGTTYVYYKANGVESNRIQVQVRGL